MLKREDIRIRDPFVLTDKENGCYYMYSSIHGGADRFTSGLGFCVYRSADLENFEEPKIIFDGIRSGFWSDRDYWAPEVHKYNGKYYLFATFKAENRCRATQILVSDTPDGTFVPLTDSPITPADWECLDGTLWVDGETPYVIFCHEWLQVGDGEICALPLTSDLKAPAGEVIKLFSASENPISTEIAELNGSLGTGSGNYVTDGPFLFIDEGKLRMIWSTFSNGRYVVLSAESDNGHVAGKWVQGGSLFDFDGGHAMVFQKLDGKRMISLHSPNYRGRERAFFAEFDRSFVKI